MSQPLTKAVRNMTSTARSLSTLTTAHAVNLAAAALLASVVGADEVLLTRLDLVGDTTSVMSGPDLACDTSLGNAFSRFGSGHPGVVSYLAPGDDGRPRRVSDIVSDREFWSSPAYREVFSGRAARYQLSLVTSLDGGVGTGWVLTRDATDFTPDDVEVAALMLPMLVCLSEVAASKARAGQDPKWCLTSRERDVLELLATGSSARCIARELGTAEATVRKHLSRIYAKLGVHDRLSASLCLQGMGPLGEVSAH